MVFALDLFSWVSLAVAGAVAGKRTKGPVCQPPLCANFGCAVRMKTPNAPVVVATLEV